MPAPTDIIQRAAEIEFDGAELHMETVLTVTLTNGQQLSGTYSSELDGFYFVKQRGADRPTMFHVSSVVTVNLADPSRGAQ